jgi:GMP synthase-like glutamine amidotransferase
VSVTHRCLVVENDPTDDPRRLGEWLTEAGLSLQTVRAHLGEPIPVDLDGYAALLVLGGDQSAHPGVEAEPGAARFPALEGLLRKAVRGKVPTLGVGLGAQLLAAAHAGLVAKSPAGPEIGIGLVAKRDAAERDPLFGPVPMIPDVIQWHHDEITELPFGAVLLAASTRYPHQAFRVGEGAWGLQFHIECDPEMISAWCRGNEKLLGDLGLTAEGLVAQAAAAMDDLFEVWQPLALRFALVAKGELAMAEPAPRSGRELPILGH